MLTLQKFTGINNVLAAEQLADSELRVATNVDLNLDGKATRRKGYSRPSAVKHTNVWEADGFVLATRGANGDLVNVTANTVLYPSLGHDRVWYVNLPDGRTAFSNGLITGIVTAAARRTWGVPIPAGVGAPYDVAGLLHPGGYQYAITHVRTADGLEGGPAYAGGAVTLAAGGLSLLGLPTLAGHTTNVYLTSHFGGERYLAGNTSGSMFSFTGKNSALVLPCRTEYMLPAPAGKLLAFWRGRALVAVGNVLYASKAHQWELFDMRRDFKQFTAPITLVQPVNGGIFVGTEEELGFLAGTEFDKLTYAVRAPVPVVLGSGVLVPGKQLKMADKDKDTQDDQCVVAIAGGCLVAGLANGDVSPITEGRYQTAATEVAATFRVVGGVPQYVAVVRA